MKKLKKLVAVVLLMMMALSMTAFDVLGDTVDLDDDGEQLIIDAMDDGIVDDDIVEIEPELALAPIGLAGGFMGFAPMAAPIQPMPWLDDGFSRIAGVEVYTNDIGFHCGFDNGGPRVYTNNLNVPHDGSMGSYLYNGAYVKLVNQGPIGIGGAERWDLVPMKGGDYVCEKCGSNLWITYSNMDTVYDGGNINLCHRLPDPPGERNGHGWFKKLALPLGWEDIEEDYVVPAAGLFEFNVFRSNASGAIVGTKLNPDTFTYANDADGQVDFVFGPATPIDPTVGYRILDEGYYIFVEQESNDWSLWNYPNGVLVRIYVAYDSVMNENVWKVQFFNDAGRGAEALFGLDPGSTALVFNEEVEKKGSLEITADISASYDKIIWKKVYKQNFHNVYKQDFHNVLKQNFYNEYKQDFFNIMKQDYHNVLKQDYHKVFKQDYFNILKQDYYNKYTQAWWKVYEQDWYEVFEQDWRNIIAPEFVRKLIQNGPYTGLWSLGSDLKGQDLANYIAPKDQSEYADFEYVKFLGNGGNAHTYAKIETSKLMNGPKWFVLATSNPNNHRIEPDQYGFYARIEGNELIISFDDHFVDTNMVARVYDKEPAVADVSGRKYFKTGDEYRIQLPTTYPAAKVTINGNGSKATMDIKVDTAELKGQALVNNSTTNYTVGPYTVEVRVKGNAVESAIVVNGPANGAIPEVIYLHPFVESMRYLTDFRFKGWKVIDSENVGDPRLVATITDAPEALRFIEDYFDDPDFVEKVLDGDPYFFRKISEGRPYFFEKVLDDDAYFFKKVTDGDPYFFRKVTTGRPYFSEKVSVGDPYFFRKVLDGAKYFFEKVNDGNRYFYDNVEISRQNIATQYRGTLSVSVTGPDDYTYDGPLMTLTELTPGEYTIVLSGDDIDDATLTRTVVAAQTVTAAFTGISVKYDDVWSALPVAVQTIDGDQGADVIIDGIQGANVIIDGRQFGDRVIDGVQGRDRVIDGDQGADVTIDGVRNADVTIDGRQHRDKIINGVQGDDEVELLPQGDDIVNPGEHDTSLDLTTRVKIADRKACEDCNETDIYHEHAERTDTDGKGWAWGNNELYTVG